MKILTVISYYHPHWTGLTVHATRVAEGLAARGHQVTVLTTRHAPELLLQERLNGVRVVRLPTLLRFSRAMIAPSFPLAAARLIAAHDVVQVHTPFPEAILVALLCRMLGRPLLLTHHGDVVMPKGGVNKVVERLAFRTLGGAGQLADGVTSYSRDYAEHSALLRPLNGKLSYVYPPVDLPAPQPEVVAAWRRELGLEGKLLLGFAGRWVEEKGFDYLLAALPGIRAAYPQAHLLYAGETNVIYERFFERCQPLISAAGDHLTLLDLILDRQMMANFYAMCDLFVLPSRTDNMPLVLIEALISGTPVVASDIPGARVVVQQTGFGLLSPPQDPAALAQTVINALRDREQLAPVASVVRSVFNSERTIGEYERLLSDVVSRRRGAPSGAAAPTPTPAAPLRYRPRGGRWQSLTASDRRTLVRMMAGEADLAYKRRAIRLMDMLDLHDGERVLDCGCGPGFYLLMMRRLRRVLLVGLDSEKSQLDHARREGVAESLLIGGAGQLPFADASFDKVLLSEVLEHVPDDHATLDELFRVLKPGGTLALSVPHDSYPFMWDPISRIWTGIGGKPITSGPIVGIWTNHQRLYSPTTLVDRLRASGFSVEVLEESTHYTFPLAHFMLYGVGKPLVERGLAPRSLDRGANRAADSAPGANQSGPISMALAVLRAIDRLNERPAVTRKRTFMNLLVKATKPPH